MLLGDVCKHSSTPLFLLQPPRALCVMLMPTSLGILQTSLDQAGLQRGPSDPTKGQRVFLGQWEQSDPPPTPSDEGAQGHSGSSACCSFA